MNIPELENAHIERRKLVDYLLDPDHPSGYSKARWLASVGYTRENASTLEAELLKALAIGACAHIKQGIYGVRYVVDTKLALPSGAYANVRTVWQWEEREGRARFITAYPRRVRRG